MEVKKTIEAALAKPMDRKQFLASAGAVALSLVGVSAALKALGEKSQHHESIGYGSSAYGGETIKRP